MRTALCDMLGIERYRSATPGDDFEGEVEPLSLWAGQGVGLARKVRPARDIVQEIARDAEAILARLSSPR